MENAFCFSFRLLTICPELSREFVALAVSPSEHVSVTIDEGWGLRAGHRMMQLYFRSKVLRIRNVNFQATKLRARQILVGFPRQKIPPGRVEWVLWADEAGRQFTLNQNQKAIVSTLIHCFSLSQDCFEEKRMRKQKKGKKIYNSVTMRAFFSSSGWLICWNSFDVILHFLLLSHPCRRSGVSVAEWELAERAWLGVFNLNSRLKSLETFQWQSRVHCSWWGQTTSSMINQKAALCGGWLGAFFHLLLDHQ